MLRNETTKMGLRPWTALLAWAALLCCVTGWGQQARGQSAPARAGEMTLRRAHYQLRAGESAPIDAPGDTLDFLVHAISRSVEIGGRTADGFAVAPDASGGRILLGASLRLPAGRYPVHIVASSPSGERREAVLDVSLQPLQTVPDGASEPPVLVLNGWQFGPSNGGCPISGSPSTTFGNHFVPSLTGAPVNAPAVYFFDNCVECPNCTIEDLGNDLAQVMALIHYQSGALVPRVDLVAHSMGGLIVRAYLAGLQDDGSLLSPVNPRVRKLILIASPNFGAFAADSQTASTLFALGAQTNELKPASTFLWRLATWNQEGDDLRGVDALAIVGTAGACNVGYAPAVCMAHANDGVVSVTSAALGFAGFDARHTRVLPYCHAEPLRLIECSGQPAIANVDEAPETGQIAVSFLSGSSDWQSIGNDATNDPHLSRYGGMYLTWVDGFDQFVSDLTQVQFGSALFTPGAWTGTVYFDDFLTPGSQPIQLTSTSQGTLSCGSLAEPAGFYSAVRCKTEPIISDVTPFLPSASGLIVQSGTTITINGAGFGQSCSGCQVLAGDYQLAVSSWSDSAISVYLPATRQGLVPIQVQASTGIDAINILASPASLILPTPSSLQFTSTVGDAAPAPQPVEISNTGGGNIPWSAASGSGWVTLSPLSGTAPASMSVAVNPAGLAPGTYTDVIAISSPAAPANPISVPVTLLVLSPPAPAVQIASVVNGASFQALPGLAPATWISIFGSGLSTVTRLWGAADFVNGKLPTSLSGVSVSINGIPAFVAYISPGQINALVPDGASTGTVQVQVTAPAGASNSLGVQEQALAPALFTTGGSYVAAVHADGTYVGKPGLIPGVVTRPAQPGETIMIFGTGFGLTKPRVPTNQLVTAPAPLAGGAQVTIGGVVAPVAYAGLVESGLYQLNVKVPSLPNGDAAFVASTAGQSTQAGVSITIQQ